MDISSKGIQQKYINLLKIIFVNQLQQIFQELIKIQIYFEKEIEQMFILIKKYDKEKN